MHSPYDTQYKFRMTGPVDRTFNMAGKRPSSSTEKNNNAFPLNEFPPCDSEDKFPVRPFTVGVTESREYSGHDGDRPSESARAMTAGFGTLSSTGVFDGPYHVSPSKARPTMKFTAGDDFFAPASEVEKPETMFTSTFLNNNDVKNLVQSKSEEDFVDGFNCFADINGVSVSVFDVEEIIKKVLGDDIPRWIIEIFVVMCRNKSQYRRVKIDDFRYMRMYVSTNVLFFNLCYMFRRIVPVALKAVNSYFLHTKQGPAYTKNDTVKRVRQPLQATAYRDDFEKPKNKWYSTKFPMTSDIKKTTQSASNQMLFRGTTKATLHVPRYTGHIPVNRAIPNKEVQSNGEKCRPKNYNMTLTYPVIGRLPGYVGK